MSVAKSRDRDNVEIVVIGAGWSGSLVSTALAAKGLTVHHVDVRGMLTDSLQLVECLTQRLNLHTARASRSERAVFNTTQHSIALEDIAPQAKHYVAEVVSMEDHAVVLSTGAKIKWDYLIVCSGARFDPDLIVKNFSDTAHSPLWYADLYRRIRSEALIAQRFTAFLQSKFVDGNASFLDDVEHVLDLAQILKDKESRDQSSIGSPEALNDTLKRSESLRDFLIAADEVKFNDVESLRTEVRTLSRALIGKYFSHGSELEVNLPASARRSLLSALEGSDISAMIRAVDAQRLSITSQLSVHLREFMSLERKRAMIAPFFLPSLWPRREALSLRDSSDVIVIGHGALAVYTSTELREGSADRRVKLLYAHERLVEQLPVAASSFVQQQLSTRYGVSCSNIGVANIVGVALEEPPTLRMRDGSTFATENFLIMGGTVPNTHFIRQGSCASLKKALDEDSRLRVNDSMQVLDGDSLVFEGCVFACGAVSNVSGSASGALDWRTPAAQAAVIVNNVLKHMKGSKLRAYKPLLPIEEWLPVDNERAVTTSNRGEWTTKPHGLALTDSIGYRLKLFRDEMESERWNDSAPKFGSISVQSLTSITMPSSSKDTTKGGGSPSTSIFGSMTSPFRKKKDKDSSKDKDKEKEKRRTKEESGEAESNAANAEGSTGKRELSPMRARGEDKEREKEHARDKEKDKERSKNNRALSLNR